jgi:hypothetical protein
LGNSKGHHFIRLAHGGGELTFVASRDDHRSELAIWFLVAMAMAMITILGAAYLFIRKILNPLHTLKAGVNTVGPECSSTVFPKLVPANCVTWLRLSTAWPGG